jgi:hypothetical protein
MVGIPASYSGHPRFKPSPQDRIFWLVIRGFSQPLQKDSGILAYLKLGHNNFHPYPFKFLIN